MPIIAVKKPFFRQLDPFQAAWKPHQGNTMHSQLPFFGVIQVSGDDRHSFLHNQLSNDIQNLAPQQACYATYNSPKGRVIANMIVHNTGEHILLILAADLLESVVKRLKMFVLRAKVQLTILPDWGISGSLNDNAQPIYPSEPNLVLFINESGEIQLPHSGSLKIAPKTELPTYNLTAEHAFNRHEILSGYPWICAATSESSVAQMLNQHTIGGIHFRKGCYPGQEIIARAQYRGQVKRGLAVLQTETPQTAGTMVLDEQQNEMGVILNSTDNLALAVIKFAALDARLQNEQNQIFTVQHIFFDATDKTE